MEFGHLEVAVNREPVAGVVLRVGSPIDTAVVAFNQIAIGQKRHFS